MALSSGTRLGPYEIQQPLGAGGMGEVYRARDTRLDRSVAIKVLAPAIAADPAARARFEREARAVAALDHPHICGIHDVGEANGTHYLVMPLIEGQTLAARLEKGPLPLDQALTVAAQVADALDKAHRQGIVHRDLKPANIMLTKAGATLLDFGLAKLRGHSGPLALSGIERLATTSPGTAEGTILGTVQYMAPEQVEGREADARADIWALGAVSYEMVTGMRAFTGETPASVIGAILRDEPQPVSKRQPLAPAALDHLVSGALEKDPQERWQSAADVARELRWIQGQRRDVGQAAASHSRSRISSGGWVIALLSLAFLAFQSFRPGPQPLAETIRFDIAPPAGAAFSMLGDTAAAWPVVSPDGSRIVFPAAVSGSPAQLWVRRLDSTETIALQGTEDASFPFWAPDSRRVGFFAGKKLKSVDLFGGTPVALADVATGAQSRGGTWNRDGTILFTPAQVSGLWTVNENGSGLTKLTELDVAAGETSHRWPVFLPDGRHFLYTIRSSEPTQGIYVGSVNEVIRKRLVGDLSNAAVDPAGYMLFARSGALVAQAFDFDTLELSGPSVPVVPRVAFSPSYYNGAFSVSATGVLAYGPGAAPTQLQWMNRSGSTLTRVGTPGDYLHPRPSPDDARIAVARLDSQLSTWDLWLIDASRSDSMGRFTYGPSSERFPVWSPDGEQLAFSAQGARGLSDILVKAVSGAGDEHPFAGVTAGDRITNFAYDWAADGKTLIFVAQRLETAWDIDTLDVQSGKVSSFLATPFVEVEPQLSFDRRWFAYSSDESGRFEVYVRPFPNGDGKWKVSTTGGRQARWRADGRELFYLAPDGTVMATPIAASARFEAGLPAALFKASVAELAPQFGRDYAVSRDGQRILINWMAEEGAHATIVTNWSAAIGSRQSPVGSR